MPLNPLLDRSVESYAIKRAIDVVYSTLLPKGGYPFIYLDLEIDPKNVDVNVHPTKKEVHFLNQDKIFESLIDTFEQVLKSANDSRTFYVQTTLHGARKTEGNDYFFITSKKYITKSVQIIAPVIENSTPSNKEVAEYKYVRTDSAATTLDAYLNRPKQDAMDVDQEGGSSVTLNNTEDTRVHVNLASIHTLRKRVKRNENKGKLFRDSYISHVLFFS